MNRNQLISLLAVLAVVGGLYVWFHRTAHAAESSDDDDAVPTLVSVQVGQITRATLESHVSGYATVEPAPASAGSPAAAARVSPGLAGVVKKVFVADGSRVKAGDLLVELEDRAEAVAVQNARETLARQRRLFAEKNTSLKNLQQAEADLATAEARLALLRVRAPLAGTVTHLAARVGEVVDLTSVLAEIADLDRLVVSTEIPSSEAAVLKPGEKVAFPGTGSGYSVLDYVSPTVNPANDSVTVRAKLPAGTNLRAGQTIEIEITTGIHTGVLAVPDASVVTDADGRSVINLVDGDEATQVQVTTGLKDKGLIEVSHPGLKAGETVVTVGAYGLPAKTKVRVVKP